MLNKEQLLMGNTGQQPVALTVEGKRWGSESPRPFKYGYHSGGLGANAPKPFWGNYTYLHDFTYDYDFDTSCSMTDSRITVTIYVSGYHDSPIRSGESIPGDIFGLKEKVGQTVYLTFDPQPDGYI